ncbi:hypothetical protein M758_4G046000 [Ceratodon purpureus]|nr:hypothetical protein M758_4G046000 [Ceratodon purpureus]
MKLLRHGGGDTRGADATLLALGTPLTAEAVPLGRALPLLIGGAAGRVPSSHAHEAVLLLPLLALLLVATKAEQALLLVLALSGLAISGAGLATVSTSGGGSGLLTLLVVASMHHILDLVHSCLKIELNSETSKNVEQELSDGMLVNVNRLR